MTLDEFVLHLQRVRDHFEWVLVLDLTPGSERRSQPRYKLRAMARQEDGLLILGPIGAVCLTRLGKVFLPEEWQFASNALAVAPTNAAEITLAANDQTWEGDHGKRKPVARLQKLRIRLLKAVDLQAPTREKAHVASQLR